MLSMPRDVKLQYMRDILTRYSPDCEWIRVKRHREYRYRIRSNYQVENFERWVHGTKFRILRSNTMNKLSAVLDDFGLETMLDKFMNYFISPIAKGFLVDDSEITLNICLGREFSCGELFFRGVQCGKHVNSDTQSEFFIVVAIGMGLEPQHLGAGSTYYYGAEEISERLFKLVCRVPTGEERKATYVNSCR